MTDKQTAIDWLNAHDMHEEADAVAAKTCSCHQCHEDSTYVAFHNSSYQRGSTLDPRLQGGHGNTGEESTR
jgi:hypothetical protein